VNRISFMTANYVAREVGWAMHGWGHGDRETNAFFSPLPTYRERFAGLLAEVRALGFDVVDVWGAHLGADWATDEHVEIAVEELDRAGLTVATYATWIGHDNVERACAITRALGADTIGAGFSGDPASLVPVLQKHEVVLAIENHPERSPAEVLARIEQGEGAFAACVDTGWWGTRGYDAAAAIEELWPHVRAVHLKDVLALDEPHETCPWGEGIVDVEACVRTLRRLGYDGVWTIEHEPEDRDPSDEVRAMRAQLEGWLR
jgi:sugar phosphate isomerase/epimerase